MAIPKEVAFAASGLWHQFLSEDQRKEFKKQTAKAGLLSSGEGFQSPVINMNSACRHVFCETKIPRAFDDRHTCPICPLWITHLLPYSDERFDTIAKRILGIGRSADAPDALKTEEEKVIYQLNKEGVQEHILSSKALRGPWCYMWNGDLKERVIFHLRAQLEDRGFRIFEVFDCDGTPYLKVSLSTVEPPAIKESSSGGAARAATGGGSSGMVVEDAAGGARRDSGIVEEDKAHSWRPEFSYAGIKEKEKKANEALKLAIKPSSDAVANVVDLLSKRSW